MKLQVVGCSHHAASVGIRERLAFSPAQVREALTAWRRIFPGAEAVMLSTCNRVEVYTAAEDSAVGPSHEAIVEFLADFHGVPAYEVFDALFERTGDDAVRHLFTVAASLDSMVLGESQILGQVKEAYELACELDSTGPLTNVVFQAAMHAAKRVTTETSIHKRRVSIPSVAVADFARAIFESFHDKHVLVIGAGEMAEETLTYLQVEGARDITVINRSAERASELAGKFGGRSAAWNSLSELLVRADLVVSTTAATEPVVTLADYNARIAPHRQERPLFILDLAIPRDFEPAIGVTCEGVYLYSIDDLSKACEQNRAERDKDLPAAHSIIEQETARFMADLHRRATGPIIKRLRSDLQGVKEEVQSQLFASLPNLDERERKAIEIAFDRLVNKLLHPPLESLRDESRHGTPHGLLDALKRLFQIKD